MTVTNKFVIPFFILHLIISLFFISTCSAVESTPSAEDLPTVHVLPDNPLYFLKTIKEKIQLVVARNASSQADLLLDFSQKRLAESLKVAEKGKIHISEKLFEAFGKDIEAAQQKIKQAKQTGEQTRDLVLKLQETAARQKSVIEKLGSQASQLNSFLVEIDESLAATQSAAPRGKIERRPEILDWIESLFGKKEVLSPIVK